MQDGRKQFLMSGLAALVALGLIVVPASAQDAAAPAVQPEAAPAGPNSGKVSFSAGIDWTSAYFFRGILQEDQGIIIQPYAELDFNVYQGEGGLNSIDLSVGVWNSLHDEHTGAISGSFTQGWYESDLYVGVSMGLWEKWTLGVVYTAYMSPNDAFDTVSDVNLSLGYDDSDCWKDLAWFDGFAPGIAFVFETDGQADQNAEPVGTDQGIYMQLGIEPTFHPFANGALADITVSVPLTVGLSLDNYYENGSGKDSTFGYLDVGLKAGIPLPIPADYGSWSLSAAVHFLYLDGATQAINGGDDFEVIGTLGISMEY